MPNKYEKCTAFGSISDGLGCSVTRKCLGIHSHFESEKRQDEGLPINSPKRMRRSGANAYANRCIRMGCAVPSEIRSVADTFPD